MLSSQYYMCHKIFKIRWTEVLKDINPQLLSYQNFFSRNHSSNHITSVLGNSPLKRPSQQCESSSTPARPACTGEQQQFGQWCWCWLQGPVWVHSSPTQPKDRAQPTKAQLNKLIKATVQKHSKLDLFSSSRPIQIPHPN